MSLKECYDKMGADYEDVLSRLRSEVLVRKFALKFLDDDSYANLKAAMESGNAPEPSARQRHHAGERAVSRRRYRGRAGGSGRLSRGGNTVIKDRP